MEASRAWKLPGHESDQAWHGSDQGIGATRAWGRPAQWERPGHGSDQGMERPGPGSDQGLGETRGWERPGHGSDQGMGATRAWDQLGNVPTGEWTDWETERETAVVTHAKDC